MILEDTEQQYNCLHNSWEKVEAIDEAYWRCTDCGATNDTPTSDKTEPTPIPEYKRRIWAMSKPKEEN